MFTSFSADFRDRRRRGLCEGERWRSCCAGRGIGYLILTAVLKSINDKLDIESARRHPLGVARLDRVSLQGHQYALIRAAFFQGRRLFLIITGRLRASGFTAVTPWLFCCTRGSIKLGHALIGAGGWAFSLRRAQPDPSGHRFASTSEQSRLVCLRQLDRARRRKRSPGIFIASSRAIPRLAPL